MKKSKLVLFVLVAIITFNLSGCGMVNEYSSCDDAANVIVEAFKANDMESINEAIFKENSLFVDEELREYYAEEDGEGIISQIIAAGDIEVKYIDVLNSAIIYDITAPNMQNVLADMPEEITTEEEFRLYIKEYIANADTNTISVSASYTKSGDTIIPEYKNPEFLNAITGGFMDAYKNAYREMIHAYLSGLEELE